MMDGYLLALVCLLCGSKVVSNSTGLVTASHLYMEKGIEFTPGQRLNDFCKPLGGENILRWRLGEVKFSSCKKAC